MNKDPNRNDWDEFLPSHTGVSVIVTMPGGKAFTGRLSRNHPHFLPYLINATDSNGLHEFPELPIPVNSLVESLMCDEWAIYTEEA